MKIYLIRHGIAELRAIDKKDAQRMLTSKGIVKTQKVARKLADLDIKFDALITSPKQNYPRKLLNIRLYNQKEIF